MNNGTTACMEVNFVHPLYTFSLFLNFVLIVHGISNLSNYVVQHVVSAVRDDIVGKYLHAKELLPFMSKWMSIWNALILLGHFEVLNSELSSTMDSSWLPNYSK
jgi:hypothetical protein